jgi:hypothetical protein
MPTPPLPPSWSQLPLPCHITPGPHGGHRLHVGAASLQIIELDGDLSAQARRLGELTRAQAAPTLRYLAAALARTLKEQGAPLPLSLRTLLGPLTTRPLLATLGDEWEEALGVLGEACAVAPRDARLAHIAPELILWAQAAQHRLRGARRPSPCPPDLLGCTSLIARQADPRQLLHGRNLDLTHGAGWRAGAMVAFINPAIGMRHVAVSTAGLLGAGLTAMNSAGLTLAVHHHLPGAIATRNTPIARLTDHIMRRAHTIAQAADIARRHRPAATWTLVMTEGDTGRAAAFEIGPTHDRLYALADDRAAMAYTNIAWDAQVADTLLDGAPALRRAGLMRLRRARQLLFEREAPMDRHAMLAALGDQLHPDTRTLRLGPSSICSIQTAASVLFEPAQRRIWVGVSEGSAAHGLYIPLSLDARGPDLRVEPIAPALDHAVSAAGRAQALWRAAWEGSAIGPDGRPHSPMIQIEHALALTPEEPDLQALAGLLAMREGRGARAEGALRRALELESDAQRRAELGLLLGLAMALHGLNGAARQQLQEVAKNPNADIFTRDRAREALWARPRAEQLRELPIDMLHAGIQT